MRGWRSSFAQFGQIGAIAVVSRLYILQRRRWYYRRCDPHRADCAAQKRLSIRTTRRTSRRRDRRRGLAASDGCPGVYSQWPASATSRQIRHTSPTALHTYQFQSGSIAPKVEAACRFSERSGRIAAIGAMEDAQAILEGWAGTVVRV